MIMYDSYKSDFLEHLEQKGDHILERRKTSVSAKDIRDNKDNILEQLWHEYQKAITEYDCDENYSFRFALDEVLGPQRVPAKQAAQVP